MQQPPHNTMSSQLAMLMDPLPHGFVVAQPQQGKTTHPPQPSSLGDYHILMMNSDEVSTFDVNMQTRSHQYDKASTSSETKPKTKESTESLMTSNGPLQIPLP